jgi:hypothetical protein
LEESEERTPRLWSWVMNSWPHVIFRAGLLLFCLACIYSEDLPIEAVFVGPGLMLSGLIMIERNKREMRDSSSLAPRSSARERSA